MGHWALGIGNFNSPSPPPPFKFRQPENFSDILYRYCTENAKAYSLDSSKRQINFNLSIASKVSMDRKVRSHECQGILF